jgi:hypothetical protein
MTKRTPLPTAPDDAAENAHFRFLEAPPVVVDGRRLIEDLGIRIDRMGRWFYHGSPIERKELICLFASTLARDENGEYWLVTPDEMGRIVVEDVPFLAVEMYCAGEGRNQRISLRTNVDEIVELDQDHPLTVITHPETGEPSPYLDVGRGLRARLTRPVFYEMVSIAVPGERKGNSVTLGVWSRGCWFPLGEIEC